MLNILSGVLSSDAGRIEIDGKAVMISSPREATNAGVAMIHQELQQVPELTVAQNIYLGAALRCAGGLLVDRAGQEAEARRLLAPLDPAIDVTAQIRDLRVAQHRIVEIAKALRSNARVIAMDEPTSSLTPTEFDRLVEVIRGLAARGVSIIYVGHKMDEVFRLCQSATILRDGRLVTQVPISATPVSQVIELMVGRELAHVAHHSFATDRVLLKVAGLTRGKAVRDAGLRCMPGKFWELPGWWVRGGGVAAADCRGGPGGGWDG